MLDYILLDGRHGVSLCVPLILIHQASPCLSHNSKLSIWVISLMDSSVWIGICALPYKTKGFPGGSYCKEPTCNEGDPGSIPGSGWYPRQGNSYPLQYSCLENSMDRGNSPWGFKESDMTEWLTLWNKRILKNWIFIDVIHEITLHIHEEWLMKRIPVLNYLGSKKSHPLWFSWIEHIPFKGLLNLE